MPRDDVTVLVFSSRRGCRVEAMVGESVDIRMAWDAPSGGGSSSRGCADDAGDGGSSPRECTDDADDGGSSPRECTDDAGDSGSSSRECADDVGDGGWRSINTEIRREYDDHQPRHSQTQEREYSTALQPMQL